MLDKLKAKVLSGSKMSFDSYLLTKIVGNCVSTGFVNVFWGLFGGFDEVFGLSDALFVSILVPALTGFFGALCIIPLTLFDIKREAFTPASIECRHLLISRFIPRNHFAAGAVITLLTVFICAPWMFGVFASIIFLSGEMSFFLFNAVKFLVCAFTGGFTAYFVLIHTCVK